MIDQLLDLGLQLLLNQAWQGGERQVVPSAASGPIREPRNVDQQVIPERFLKMMEERWRSFIEQVANGDVTVGRKAEVNG